MLKNIKRIVVLGGAESGCGSAVLAKIKGYDVFLSDIGEIEQRYVNILNDYAIDFEQKLHSSDKILSADMIIKSPGIPDSVALIFEARVKGISIVSELEFAKYYSNAKTICITGSNGKTTTATLIYKILNDAGYNVGLAGNIGQSYAMQVATRDFDWYVLEVSSFQLDGMFDFKADISVLTNITPDHLDRYEYNMENYVNSKLRICNNQSDGEYFIYCADDKEITSHLSVIPGDVVKVPYSITHQNENAVLLEDKLHIALNEVKVSLDVNDIKIKGLHNIANVMASVLAGILAGVNDKSIINSVEQFDGVEHRVEYICNENDILYINDSKATNVDAVWYALESMQRPVVWIAGGTDKGNDYSTLIELAREKVHTLICMGVDNSKLIDVFDTVIPEIYDTHSLENAILAVKRAASSGDVVLLSPACASFDLFQNYEHRGELFKKAILEITKKQGLNG